MCASYLWWDAFWKRVLCSSTQCSCALCEFSHNLYRSRASIIILLQTNLFSTHIYMCKQWIYRRGKWIQLVHSFGMKWTRRGIERCKETMQSISNGNAISVWPNNRRTRRRLTLVNLCTIHNHLIHPICHIRTVHVNCNRAPEFRTFFFSSVLIFKYVWWIK